MKRGTRVCAAGLLALSMALGSAPVLGAMAPATAVAETIIPGNDTVLGELDWAIVKDGKVVETGSKTKADNDIATQVGKLTSGETLYLGAGEFSMRGQTAINYSVSIVGEGAGVTVITSKCQNPFEINSKEDAADITFSGLTIRNTGSEKSSKGVVVTDGNTTDTKNVGTLTMSNCEIDGFAYGIAQTKDNKASIVLDNVKMTKVWTAVSVDQKASANVQFGFAEGSEYAYAVREYAFKSDGTIAREGYYATVDAFNADVDHELNNVKDARFEDASTYNANDFTVVASNGDFRYVTLDAALWRAQNGDSIEVVKDAKVTNPNVSVSKNDVTVEGNGHLLTFAGTVTVDGNNFTLQNVKVNGTANNLFVFTGNGYNYTLKDVRLNQAKGAAAAFVAQNGAAITVAGTFELTASPSSEAAVYINGHYGAGHNQLVFASDAEVKYIDATWDNIPFAKLDSDAKFVFPSVSSNNGAINVTVDDVDGDKDGEFNKPNVDYKNVYVEALAEDPNADVTMWRMYNPYSGEHLLTTDANEVASLLGVGWRQDDIEMTFPATSETPVYRLYNSYTGEHHYTTDEGEYDALVEAGWTGEGVKFYSAESGVAVARLYNPYAASYNHVFTTDTNEVSTLLSLGWELEASAAFYAIA